MIVTAYRIDSGFCNVMDRVALTPPRSDAIYSEIRLVMPAGYELSETVYGEPAIYDEDGNHCELCLNNLRGTVVLAVSEKRQIGLKKAPKGENPVPLQEARLAAGLTLKQLSEASGVNVRQIQRVELGESEAGNLTARNLISIADALGVDARNLI